MDRSNNMKYSIDRIEGNIAILEDINNKEKLEVDISLLPSNIKAGSILLLKNNIYIIDETEEDIRRKRIMEKFNKLKK